jgi:hypothetical protein
MHIVPVRRLFLLSRRCLPRRDALQWDDAILPPRSIWPVRSTESLHCSVDIEPTLANQ